MRVLVGKTTTNTSLPPTTCNAYNERMAGHSANIIKLMKLAFDHVEPSTGLSKQEFLTIAKEHYLQILVSSTMIDLCPLWEVLSQKNNLKQRPLKAVMFRIAAWGKSIDKTVRLPQALTAIPMQKRLEARTACQVPKHILDPVLLDIRKTAPQRRKITRKKAPSKKTTAPNYKKMFQKKSAKQETSVLQSKFFLGFVGMVLAFAGLSLL